jgi:hypothetical protein
MECYLDDDGHLSSDFIAVEGVPDGVQCAPQALWIGVRPVWRGSEPGEVMVQVCYQEAHMASLLSGPVWLTPKVWRQLDRAVRRRLRHRKRQDMKRRIKR